MEGLIEKTKVNISNEVNLWLNEVASRRENECYKSNQRIISPHLK